MGLTDLLTLAGLSLAVAAVFEVGKKVVKPSPEHLDRFGALAAILLGVGIGGGAAALQNADVVLAITNGILAGLSAVGLYKAAAASPLPIG
ncbi:MAG TPA: hypothetical protein VGA97_02990 [Acidimicrobiia bacterium]|jgi:hypothetical protein